MGHFITAKEAMQKYGIRERQIWDVIYYGKISIYDDRGIKLSMTEVLEHVTFTLGNIHTIYADTPQIARKYPARDAQIRVISELLFVASDFDSAYKKTFANHAAALAQETLQPQGSLGQKEIKIATIEACNAVIAGVKEGSYLDAHGEIRREEFLEYVKQAMLNSYGWAKIHVTEAKNIFAKSPILQRVKRSQGRRKTK